MPEPQLALAVLAETVNSGAKTVLLGRTAEEQTERGARGDVVYLGKTSTTLLGREYDVETNR